MRIDTEYLLNRRRKKLEFLKYDTTHAYYDKMEFIKHTEEMIQYLSNINNYNVSGKNLALKLVHDAIWWPEDDYENTKLVKYNAKFNELTGISAEDKTTFETASNNRDLTVMAQILDKYVVYNSFEHRTLLELSLDKEYIDIFTNAYMHIDNKLDEIIQRLPLEYEYYLNNITSGDIIMSFDRFSEVYTINAGFLISGLGRNDNPTKYSTFLS